VRRLTGKTLLVLGWLLLPWLTAGGAQGAELGLWDCVRYSATSHPLVQAGQWGVEGARSTVEESRTYFRPDFSAGGHFIGSSYEPKAKLPGRTIALGGYTDYGVSTEVDYLLYDWGRRKGRLDGSLQLEQASLHSLGAVRLNLAYAAGANYFLLFGARDEKLIAEGSLRTAEEHYRYLQSMKDGGLITYDEVLNGEVRLEQERIRLNRSVNSLELARLELLRSLGLTLESQVEFSDSAEALPEVSQGGPLLEQALARRPDLAQYASRIAALESQALALAADKKPTVSVFAAGYAAKPGLDMFRNEFIEYARAGVSLNWAFWDWKRRDFRVQRVRAEQEQTRAERQDLEQRIALEIRQAEVALREAADRLELAGKAQNAAQEHFRLLGDRFAQGRATNRDFLDAEVQATNSALDLSRARIDLALARWRLAYVDGSLSGEIETRWPDLAAGDKNANDSLPEKQK
jgi:outer membrane protein